jgi:hypothetical protein
MHLLDLPNEILLEILDITRLDGFFSLVASCRHLHNLAEKFGLIAKQQLIHRLWSCSHGEGISGGTSYVHRDDGRYPYQSSTGCEKCMYSLYRLELLAERPDIPRYVSSLKILRSIYPMGYLVNQSYPPTRQFDSTDVMRAVLLDNDESLSPLERSLFRKYQLMPNLSLTVLPEEDREIYRSETQPRFQAEEKIMAFSLLSQLPNLETLHIRESTILFLIERIQVAWEIKRLGELPDGLQTLKEVYIVAEKWGEAGDVASFCPPDYRCLGVLPNLRKISSTATHIAQEPTDCDSRYCGEVPEPKELEKLILPHVLVAASESKGRKPDFLYFEQYCTFMPKTKELHIRINPCRVAMSQSEPDISYHYPLLTEITPLLDTLFKHQTSVHTLCFSLRGTRGKVFHYFLDRLDIFYQLPCLKNLSIDFSLLRSPSGWVFPEKASKREVLKPYVELKVIKLALTIPYTLETLSLHYSGSENITAPWINACEDLGKCRSLRYPNLKSVDIWCDFEVMETPMSLFRSVQKEFKGTGIAVRMNFRDDPKHELQKVVPGDRVRFFWDFNTLFYDERGVIGDQQARDAIVGHVADEDSIDFVALPSDK